jgi:uncharacterized protein (DUF1697 family)
MTRVAALLRGVNVGGHRKLPMADLARCLIEAGYGGVRTLLASGNVVLTAEADVRALEIALEQLLTDRLGLVTDVLVRSGADLERVVAGNPFPDVANGSQLLVLFHRDPVPADRVAALLDGHGGPERIAAQGRELYIDFAGGMRDSPVTARMAKLKFPRRATGRNMNTVVKLRDLTA